LFTCPNLDKTLTFYKNIFGLFGIQIEDGMITIELPNLSLFLMEKDAFEMYSRKAGREVQFPNDNVGAIINKIICPVFLLIKTTTTRRNIIEILFIMI